METASLPFAEKRPLTEEQRTDAVKLLLSQGFSVGEIATIAPSLLAAEPATESLLAIPLGVS